MYGDAERRREGGARGGGAVGVSPRGRRAGGVLARDCRAELWGIDVLKSRWRCFNESTSCAYTTPLVALWHLPQLHRPIIKGDETCRRNARGWVSERLQAHTSSGRLIMGLWLQNKATFCTLMD